MIEDEIERFYSTFVNHVAEGRNMTYEEVDEIAQGRVWSGEDALELGLVDEMGGLNQAIEAAAELAELEDFRTIGYPKMKDPFEQIMQDILGDMQSRTLQNELGPYYEFYNYLDYIRNASGIQARLPFYITVE